MIELLTIDVMDGQRPIVVAVESGVNFVRLHKFIMDAQEAFRDAFDDSTPQQMGWVDSRGRP